jgi:hypothetical protein
VKTYKVTVKRFNQFGYSMPSWYAALKELDYDADLAQLNDDHNGNNVFEIASNADLTQLRNEQGVVSVENQP